MRLKTVARKRKVQSRKTSALNRMKLKELFYRIPPFSSVKKQYLIRHDRHEAMIRRLQAELAARRYPDRLRELAGICSRRRRRA